jgi:hypothetical protein
MKLPDFSADQDLNNLRKAMGASLGNYSPAPLGPILTTEEIQKLATEGIARQDD